MRLNYSASNTLNQLGTNNPYYPGNVTIQTVNASDVLSIQDAVHQHDSGSAANFVNNNNGNAIPNPNRANNYISDPNKIVTVNIAGPGRVVLQEGGITSNSTFGGAWSIGSSGSVGTSVLQVGPYQTNSSGASSWTVWYGPQGQPLNALGFKTINGQTYGGGSSVQGDPDIPNQVTVNTGGTFIVSVDQANQSLSLSASDGGVNGTPNYLRNPIILNGGALAASGSEVTFGWNYKNGYDNTQGTVSEVSYNSTLVTAKLGGNFTVCPGTSTIDTYDPIGGTGARTVQLLAGTRVISNSTSPLRRHVLTYNTSWAGTLNVNGGGYGGQFDLMRDSGGSVSVAPGATINIQNGATVKLLDLTTDKDSNGNAEEPAGAVRTPTAGSLIQRRGTA